MTETQRRTTPQQMAELLFIHTQTGMHAGSGTALGTVDLPIQRERHTQWPIIPGSTLKGILRDACRDRVAVNYSEREEDGRRLTRRDVANRDDVDLVAAFGPDRVHQQNGHAGAISVTDARILAFPVRSLKGVFAWVTCPSVLGRMARDVRLCSQNDQELPKEFTISTLPGKDANKPLPALCVQNGPLVIDGNKLLLEEFDFEVTGEAAEVAPWIAQHAVADDFTRERIKSHLAVLHDDDFTHFVRHATEVVARVALNPESKTVKAGALFYQEFLPPETLFYSVVLASPSRLQGYAKSAEEMMAYLRENLPPVMQIGGDETIGKGVCTVRLSGGAQ